ncbi:MAG: DUF4162 domain-containing protein, partial [Candidatus Bathyarchaeia archaeon]
STIILATNELFEADVLSDRVGIMHKGKMLVCDTPKTLKDSILGGDIVEVQLEKEVSQNVLGELKGFKEVVEVVVVKSDDLRIRLNKVENVVPQIVNLFLNSRLPISSIRMSEPSLDDVFVYYTGLTIEEAEQKSKSR